VECGLPLAAKLSIPEKSSPGMGKKDVKKLAGWLVVVVGE